MPPNGSAAAPIASTGHRVLVADDNKDAADSLAMVLELSGHEVRVAHGGRAALTLAQTFRPDVALLDIGMPELNGYEVAKELRRKPWGTGILLIALTGWGQDDASRRLLLARRGGASALLLPTGGELHRAFLAGTCDAPMPGQRRQFRGRQKPESRGQAKRLLGFCNRIIGFGIAGSFAAPHMFEAGVSKITEHGPR